MVGFSCHFIHRESLLGWFCWNEKRKEDVFYLSKTFLDMYRMFNIDISNIIAF